jgi:hypothetical protein
MTSFPRENMETAFSALDSVPNLAISILQDDPLACASYSAFIMFPRIILRSLPPRCKGKHVALAFEKRCKMMIKDQVSDLMREAHDSHVT